MSSFPAKLAMLFLAALTFNGCASFDLRREDRALQLFVADPNDPIFLLHGAAWDMPSVKKKVDVLAGVVQAQKLDTGREFANAVVAELEAAKVFKKVAYGTGDGLKLVLYEPNLCFVENTPGGSTRLEGSVKAKITRPDGSLIYDGNVGVYGEKSMSVDVSSLARDWSSSRPVFELSRWWGKRLAKTLTDKAVSVPAVDAEVKKVKEAVKTIQGE